LTSRLRGKIRANDPSVKISFSVRGRLTPVSKVNAADIIRRRINERIPRGEQERISGLAAIAAETISRWRNGGTINPDLKTMERLAEAIGISLAELISDSPEERSAPPPPPIDPGLQHRLEAGIQRASERLREAARDVAALAELFPETERR
jgi:transcriptional regulator with XRE-family HTH domain